MLYSEFVKEVCDLAIDEFEDTQVSYIIPEYKKILHDNSLLVSDISDYSMTDEQLRNLIVDQVARRNAKTNMSNYVSNWLYQIIAYSIDPVIQQENNELVGNMLKYMQANENLKKLENENQKLKNEEVKVKTGKHSKITGVNFSKKKR